MFSEDIFACARAWHRDAAARAFLAHSESSCTALCAMNAVPVSLTATVEPRGLLALELRARCCPHRRCVLSEADRLCLAQQLRQKSSASSSSSSGGGGSGGGGRAFAAALRQRLHEASCRWRRIDAEAAECLVRHRCAALVLSKASWYAFGSSSSSSSPLPRPPPPPLPPLPPLSSSLSPSPPLQSSDRQSAVSCVLPRGTPPAFVRARLMPPTAEWIAAAAGERGPMCDAPVEVQRALFMRKRPRGTAVDSSLSQSLALGSPLALLVALFGFSFRVGGTGAHWAARVGADAACHYCGAAPAVLETPEENQKDSENCENHEVGENYENREDDEHYENREDDEHYEDHDDHEGDNEEELHCSGSAAPPVTICIDAHSSHCPNCPWRQLMLAPALRTSSSSTTVLEFDCGAARLRFALPDVVALMSLWRRSEHCEKSIGCGAYVSDAITAAVRAAIPPPPDAAVAAFLQSLRTHCPHHSDADCKDCKDCCVDYEDCYEEDCYEDDAIAVCCRAAALVLAPGGPSADFFAAEASAWRNVLREAAPLAEIHSPVKAAEAQGAFCEMYERTARRPLAESREPSAVEAVAAGVLEALRAAGSAEESRELKGAADPRVAAFLDAMDTAGKSTVRVGVGEAQRSAKPIARSAPHHHHHHHQQQHHQQQSHQQHYQHQHHQYQQQSQHRHSHHHQHHQEQQHEHQHPRVFQSQSFRSNSVLPMPGANAPSLWEQHQHQHHQQQHHHHHHQHQHHHQHMMKQQAVSVGSPFAAESSGVLSDAYAQRPLAPADRRNDRGGRFRGRGGRGGGGRPFRGRADK